MATTTHRSSGIGHEVSNYGGNDRDVLRGYVNTGNHGGYEVTCLNVLHGKLQTISIEDLQNTSHTYLNDSSQSPG